MVILQTVFFVANVDSCFFPLRFLQQPVAAVGSLTLGVRQFQRTHAAQSESNGTPRWTFNGPRGHHPAGQCHRGDGRCGYRSLALFLGITRKEVMQRLVRCMVASGAFPHEQIVAMILACILRNPFQPRVGSQATTFRCLQCKRRTGSRAGFSLQRCASPVLTSIFSAMDKYALWKRCRIIHACSRC